MEGGEGGEGGDREGGASSNDLVAVAHKDSAASLLHHDDVCCRWVAVLGLHGHRIRVRDGQTDERAGGSTNTRVIQLDMVILRSRWMEAGERRRAWQSVAERRSARVAKNDTARHSATVRASYGRG